MSYEIRPGAEDDYLEAFVFYGIRQPGMELEFEAEFESLVDRICEIPRMYRVKYLPDIRQARMGRFPYSVYYREVEDGIEIIAVSHDSQRPGYWLDRI